MNYRILNKILEIEKKFSYISGVWSENEYIQAKLAEEELNYIINKCKKENFKYKIDNTITKEVSEEYEEEEIDTNDIENIEINDNNLFQIDAIAFDIEKQLLEHLKKQL